LFLGILKKIAHKILDEVYIHVYTWNGLYIQEMVMVIRTVPKDIEKIRQRVDRAMKDYPPPEKPDIPTLREMIESQKERSPAEAPKRSGFKKAVSIRLDPDIVEFFKKEGPGWQTRINMVLRSHMINQR
jgi:uncharacterized protein (DUF4415 family)